MRSAINLRHARCEPMPVQRPHPPIVMGGTGPNRTLRSVVRLADHWKHPEASIDNWKAGRDVLLQRCEEVRIDRSTITASLHVLAGGSAPARLTDDCEAWGEAGPDPAIVYLPTPCDPAPLPAPTEARAPLAG